MREKDREIDEEQPVWDDDDTFEARYAPMKRLLSETDVEYLRSTGAHEAAAALRSQHRAIFRGYVAQLSEEIGELQRIRRDHIARGEVDDLYSYYRDSIMFKYHLTRLSVAPYLHALQLPGAHELAQTAMSCLEQLVVSRTAALAAA